MLAQRSSGMHGSSFAANASLTARLEAASRVCRTKLLCIQLFCCSTSAACASLSSPQSPFLCLAPAGFRLAAGSTVHDFCTLMRSFNNEQLSVATPALIQFVERGEFFKAVRASRRLVNLLSRSGRLHYPTVFQVGALGFPAGSNACCSSPADGCGPSSTVAGSSTPSAAPGPRSWPSAGNGRPSPAELFLRGAAGHVEAVGKLRGPSRVRNAGSQAWWPACGPRSHGASLVPVRLRGRTWKSTRYCRLGTDPPILQQPCNWHRTSSCQAEAAQQRRSAHLPSRSRHLLNLPQRGCHPRCSAPHTSNSLIVDISCAERLRLLIFSRSRSCSACLDASLTPCSVSARFADRHRGRARPPPALRLLPYVRGEVRICCCVLVQHGCQLVRSGGLGFA